MQGSGRVCAAVSDDFAGIYPIQPYYPQNLYTDPFEVKVFRVTGDIHYIAEVLRVIRLSWLERIKF